MCRGLSSEVAVKSDWVYEVENLIMRVKVLVLARFFSLYRTEMIDLMVDPILLLCVQHAETTYEDAKEPRDTRSSPESIGILM